MYATLPNNTKVFYREAGEKQNPVVLLLHGFPASSFQYRDLIPILATKYHVIAPDFPGYGFTTVPESYTYNFANLTTTLASFLDALDIRKFAVYVFDYGAPAGLRLALQRPDAITAIITQNGNAYTDGLGAFWDPLKAYWREDTKSNRDALRGFLSLESTKWQYHNGEPDPDNTVDPASYHLDYHLMATQPGNHEIQLDMLKDYATNLPLYPQFQEYFRKSQVPLLAIWGKNDEIFIAPGAEAFKRDLPNATVKLLDAGHFAVESHTEEIGKEILEFLEKNNI